MVTPILADADLDQVAAAVAEAESRTSAEIVCVITREVSTYPEVPLVAGVLAALVLAPAAALVLAALPLDAGWRIGHAAATGLQPQGALLSYALLQAALFGAAAWLAAVSAVRRRLTPDGVKRARVRKAALQQFQSARFADAGKPGLVIFVALHEHKVEIIADPGAHEAAGEAVWSEAVAALRDRMRANRPAEGLIEAVRICGAALALRHPAAGPDANTHPDRALQI